MTRRGPRISHNREWDWPRGGQRPPVRGTSSAPRRSSWRGFLGSASQPTVPSRGLQPSHEALLAGKHFSCLITHSRNHAIARFSKPRHVIAHAAIFFLVFAFPSPVVDLNAAP